MGWICDGVPKNGKQYSYAFEHEPYENDAPDCAVCGLPSEAQKGQTVRSQGTIISQDKPKWLIPVIAVGVALLVAGIGYSGYEWYSAREEGESPSTTTSASASGFVSNSAINAGGMSQGEKILLDSTPEKEAAASAFVQEDWEGAIAQYSTAVQANINDPESKIYLQNAQARKAGTPLTIAVAVPITPDPNSAKEVLRGVASYQEEFNQSPPSPTQLLEVVIVDDASPTQAASIAQDLTANANILGVIGHGIDPGSQQALRMYDAEGLAAISPVNATVSTQGNESLLKTIPVDQKANELVNNYLQAASKTLIQYAQSSQSSPQVMIFYDGDNPYSQQFNQAFTTALATENGTVVKQVDVNATGFNATTELANGSQNGANAILLALGKDSLNAAVEVAKANASLSQPMTLLSSDRLYNAPFLVEGGDSIAGVVLAVPWTFQPNDPFAANAVASWKGRVSWRTATAYDATKALGEALRGNPSRSGVSSLLGQGVTLSGTNMSFDIFDEVPLARAVKGVRGPTGSSYQFDPVQ